MAILDLKNKRGSQILQYSGGPFGLRGVKISRGFDFALDSTN